MDVKTLKRLIRALDEIEVVKAAVLEHQPIYLAELSDGMRNAIMGACIERRSNLRHQLEALGVDFDA